MIDFIQMLVNGIAAGSSYALIGLAMVIIYKTSEVPNFAQGEMALITTYFAYMLLAQYGFPSYLAFPLSLVFAAALGCGRRDPAPRAGSAADAAATVTA